MKPNVYSLRMASHPDPELGKEDNLIGKKTMNFMQTCVQCDLHCISRIQLE